uniref:Uncharacterized protein n=1 Tax=Timema genevievae TaxID=629358 RepID=A0A7R9KAH9_TIMGE|nr:unnamed protein product [Timema genevievae]
MKPTQDRCFMPEETPTHPPSPSNGTNQVACFVPVPSSHDKYVTREVTCPLSLICDETEEVGTLKEALEQRTEENVDRSQLQDHRSSHYVADDTEQQGWYHCDDENVYKSTEEAVLGHDQQQNELLVGFRFTVVSIKQTKIMLAVMRRKRLRNEAIRERLGYREYMR